MRRILFVLLALVLLLPGCGAQSRELPPPAELFAAIQSEVELPEMADAAETDLEALTGIEPDSYDSAVCCRLYEGTAPDEIIIVQARDGEAAGNIQSLLEKRLEYKRQSGGLYLTEYQPMLQAGVVRRDGLTVSLVVSERAEEIALLYQDLLAGQRGPLAPLAPDQVDAQLAQKIMENELIMKTDAHQNGNLVILENPGIWYLAESGITPLGIMLENLESALN